MPKPLSTGATFVLLSQNPEVLLRSMQKGEKERKENEKAIQEQNTKAQKKLLSSSTKHFDPPQKPAYEKIHTPQNRSRRRG